MVGYLLNLLFFCLNNNLNYDIMHPSITLNLNDEFCVACLLYNIDPEVFLQEFIFNITLPAEHVELEPENILSTSFMIDYVELRESRETRQDETLAEMLAAMGIDLPACSGYTEEQVQFLMRKERQCQVLCRNRVRYGKEAADEALKLFLKFWLKEWRERFGK